MLVCILGLIVLSGCGDSNNAAANQGQSNTQADSKPIENSTANIIAATVETTAATTTAPSIVEETQRVDLSGIEVRHELQNTFENGKQKLVVFIKNNSKSIFSGDLNVLAKGGTETIAHDTIFVEKLKPGQQTFTILWSKPSDYAELKYEWYNTKMEDNKTTEDGKINQADSNALRKYYDENFGDLISSDMKTSWHDAVKSIEVYENGSSKWAIVKIDTGHPKGSDQGAMNAIIGALFFNDKISLSKVELQDLDGKYITEKSGS